MSNSATDHVRAGLDSSTHLKRPYAVAFTPTKLTLRRALTYEEQRWSEPKVQLPKNQTHSMSPTVSSAQHRSELISDHRPARPPQRRDIRRAKHHRAHATVAKEADRAHRRPQWR